MPGWKLIPLTPLDQQIVFLRRFMLGRADDAAAKCPGPYTYHDAQARVGVAPIEWKGEGDTRYIENIPDAAYPRSDARWPKGCAYCGYVFTDADTWQINGEQQYKALDGTLYTTKEAPVGACWQAWWMFDGKRWDQNNASQPGAPLYIKCPPGKPWSIWAIDGGSTNGSGWQRTGDYSTMTATPSILFPGKQGEKCVFHSFLQNGILLADIEGNVFPDCPYTA